MGFWEWMGFENPRDSPKTEQPKEGLPKVTDNVRDSGQTFVFGRSNAGEQVDEKAAMQIRLCMPVSVCWQSPLRHCRCICTG